VAFHGENKNAGDRLMQRPGQGVSGGANATSRPAIGLRSLVLTLLFGALVMVWAFVYHDSIEQRRRIHEHNQFERQAMAQALAEHTRATLHRIDAVLLSLRQGWQLQNGEFAAALAEHQGHLADISLQISVIGADGKLAFTNLGRPADGVFLGDRKHFLAHVGTPGDQLFVGPPVKGRVSNRWTVQLSRRLIVDQRFGGVIVASIDPAYFARFYTQANLGPHTVVAMVRDSGEFISRSVQLEAVLGRSSSEFPFLKPGAALAASFENRSPIDGQHKLSAWHRLPEFGLTVLVSEDSAAIEARATAGNSARIALGLALSLAWIALAWVLLRGAESSARARRELLSSEDRFERFFRASPVAHMLSRARDQKYAAVNQAFCDLFETSEDATVGRTSLEGGFWIDPAARTRYIDAVIMDGRCDNFEATYRTASGKLFPARQTGVLVDLHGEPHLVSTIVDISGEVALREANARNAAIVGSAMDAIVTCDDSLSIVVFNQAAALMFGVPAEQAVGTSIDRFIPQRFCAAHAGHVRRFGAEHVTSRSHGRPGEIVGLRADGSEFPAEASISHVNTGGRQLFTVIMRDVTLKKRAEQDLRDAAARLEQRVVERTAELTESIAEMEDMTSTISHDLRAPLHRMSGFASLLALEDGVRDNPVAIDFTGRIVNGARRMEALIDKLIENARLGRSVVEYADVPMQRLVEGYIADLSATLEARRIEWVVAALPTVRGDPVMVRQVVQNLIENAVKYTARREHARIEIGAVETVTEAGFFVKDNGVGFEMKYSRQLFGVFKRLHSEAEFTGFGIGLANVRRIVQRHRGRVWFEAELDQGATFFVAFPKTEFREPVVG
jgi:PAS domain S-box-containing protein